MYLLFSFISGVLETGALLVMLPKYGIVAALITALCYQLGNAVPSPLKLSRSITSILSIVGEILCLVSMRVLGCLPIAILASVLSLQSAKSVLNVRYGNIVKRSVRILGFIVGIIIASCFSRACTDPTQTNRLLY